MSDRFTHWTYRIVLTVLLLAATGFALVGEFGTALEYSVLAFLFWANTSLVLANRRLRTQLHSANEQLRIAHLKGGHL
ncbi:hypothetical protein QNA23_10820 [Rhodococcus erythropolis]|uniref:hypothetical protein n=1 Tax=Rhodococcus erythropolis TaxID=1833 RepID=UPI0024B990E1|nr:hypothetical protein [Rhodococcus erythropolis]MDJ0403975.1 hypothetical protein [Rhodococcus erythropolis]